MNQVMTSLQNGGFLQSQLHYLVLYSNENSHFNSGPTPRL